MKFWSQAPIVRILPPFLAGILVAIYVEAWIGLATGLVIVAGLTVLLYCHRKSSEFATRWKFGVLVHLALFMAGVVLTRNNTDRLAPDHYEELVQPGQVVMAMVDDHLVERTKTVKTTLTLMGVRNSTDWSNISGSTLAYLQIDSICGVLKRGDIIVFRADFQDIPPPQNPGEFNYQQYMRFHNIAQQVYLPSGKWGLLSENKGNALVNLTSTWRKKLQGVFQSYGLQGREYAVASALILGNKDMLDDELMQNYASAGAMHVLAVSGLHVGVIFLVFNTLLCFMNKSRTMRIIKALVLILLLWFYACLTGLSPSVMRAATMLSFIIAGRASLRPTNTYNVLAASALLLLVIDPFLIMEVGFQLSYLAVLGILYLQPKIYRWWAAPGYLLDKVWAITAVSIAAQVATFPLALLYFHQFPAYFLFSNLIVIPAASIILYLGLLLFITSYLPLVAGFLASLLCWVIQGLNGFTSLIDRLPFSIANGISINVTEVWIIYLLLVLLLVFLSSRKAVYLYACSALASVFLCMNIVEASENLQQRQFIVYHVNGHSAYDFINGTNHVALADSALLQNEDKVLFHIRHNWWEMNLGSENMLALNDTLQTNFILRKGSFIQFSDKNVLLLNEQVYQYEPPGKVKLDYIIVPDNVWFDAEWLHRHFEVGQVIIDSSNNDWRAGKLAELCAQYNLNHYNVVDEGAFIASW